MLAARVAHADTPGAPDDALSPIVDQALAVRTPGGFSLEGTDGATYLDGFEMPLFHRDGRSALAIAGEPPRLSEQAEASAGFGPRVDATVPHGITALELTSQQALAAADASNHGLFAGAVLRASLERMSVRRGEVLDLPPLAFDGAAVFRAIHADHFDLDFHLLEFAEGHTGWADGTRTPDHRIETETGNVRLNMLAHYHDGPWRIAIDRSFGFGGVTTTYGSTQRDKTSYLDLSSRDEIRRSYEAFHGLTEVEWITALEVRVARFTRDVVGPLEPRENVARVDEPSLDDVSHVSDDRIWRPNVALSTGMKARLAHDVTGYVGLRTDWFAGDAVLGPRAELAVRCGRLTCRLDAGAYRRPAERGEELEHPELHAERTTRVALTADNAHGELRFYYADHSRLIVRDALGTYSNDGRGTTYGAFGLIRGHLGKLAAQLSVRLEHAERQDGPRLLVRPYEYDQPVRLEARVERELRHWRVGLRFELREGLPYTNVVGASYDSDRDLYTPAFASLYGERLPWQHQLDLRIDRTWKVGGGKLAAFLDIANVYDHRGAVGYAYNFNFTERRAIEALPVWPTIGVRGEL